MPTQLARLARDGKINAQASVRDAQSKIINAPIEKVWETITSVENWPSWNKEITIIRSDIAEASKKFVWDDQSRKFKSTFQRVDKPYVLSWTDQSLWIRGIHVWSFEKTEDYQTIATIEVSLQGFIVPLLINHLKLHGDLLNWLSRLKWEVEQSL